MTALVSIGMDPGMEDWEGQKTDFPEGQCFPQSLNELWRIHQEPFIDTVEC